jgi:hypothetical protein
MKADWFRATSMSSFGASLLAMHLVTSLAKLCIRLIVVPNDGRLINLPEQYHKRPVKVCKASAISCRQRS